MILGLSSFAFGWSIGFPGDGSHNSMSLEDLLDWTRKMGLLCLQIGDNLPLHELTEDDLNSFGHAAFQDRIRIEVGAKGLTELHLDQYIRISEKIGAPFLRFVIDSPGYTPDLETIGAIIRERLPDLRSKSIVLGIENHDRFKAKELAKLVDKINDPYVGICLDCVNSMGAGEGLEYVAEILSPFTVNLHLKDFVVRRLPHMMGFIIEGAIAGRGMVNFPLLIEKVRKYERCESAILELWVPPDENIQETKQKERIWVNESLRYLGNYI